MTGAGRSLVAFYVTYVGMLVVAVFAMITLARIEGSPEGEEAIIISVLRVTPVILVFVAGTAAGAKLAFATVDSGSVRTARWAVFCGIMGATVSLGIVFAVAKLVDKAGTASAADMLGVVFGAICGVATGLVCFRRG